LSPSQLKLSVGSGIEFMVSKASRPIRTVQSENHTDRLAKSPTGSRSLSKLTVEFEEMRVTGRPYTEFNLSQFWSLKPQLASYTSQLNLSRFCH
jgi:hypothetical protein